MKTTKEYIPFGEEWKKEILKHSKSELIDIFLKPTLMRNQELEDKVLRLIDKLKK